MNISMESEVTQTAYLYTWRTIECFHSIGPHAHGIGPALGRQSVLRCVLPCPDYKTPISGDCSDTSDTWEYVM